MGDGITTLRTGLEELDGIPDSSVDISYSLAVLEHISNLDACLAALARVMRVGGVSCHQIDMRNHLNFDQPWDFLLDDKAFYDAINSRPPEERHPFFGNRIRLGEFMDSAKRHGFQTVHVKRNHEKGSKEGYEYAEKTLKKLRKCNKCQYKDWPREDLDGCTENNMPMTGVFWCIKYHGVQQPADQEKPPCGMDDWSTCD